MLGMSKPLAATSVATSTTRPLGRSLWPLKRLNASSRADCFLSPWILRGVFHLMSSCSSLSYMEVWKGKRLDSHTSSTTSTSRTAKGRAYHGPYI